MSMLAACLLLIGVVVVTASPAGNTSNIDNVNEDDTAEYERFIKSYYDCLLGKGDCTPGGAELKSVLPDALQTACSKCSPKQKVDTEKIIKYLINKKPALYTDLEKKYDPNGIYSQRYRDEAAKDSIKM